MTLNQEQVNTISSSISINDIISYINSHLSEYEEFINYEKNAN